VRSFYQRILASDPDVVAFQAEELLKTMPLLDYEDVALPALALAQIDIARGVLDPHRQAQVCDAVERVLADLSDHVDVEPVKDENPEVAQTPTDASPLPPQALAGSALCLAGRTPLDQAACAILVQLLERKGISTRVAGPDALSTSGIFALDTTGLDLICIFYLDRQSLARSAIPCGGSEKKSPNIPIAVCLWGSGDLAPMADAARADTTIGILQEAFDFCAGPVKPVKTGQVLPFEPASAWAETESSM
jgi:hypothetical protein